MGRAGAKAAAATPENVKVSYKISGRGNCVCDDGTLVIIHLKIVVETCRGNNIEWCIHVQKHISCGCILKKLDT